MGISLAWICGELGEGQRTEVVRVPQRHSEAFTPFEAHYLDSEDRAVYVSGQYLKHHKTRIEDKD